MSWKEKVFQNFKLLAVTDLQSSSAAELDKIEAAYQGGADIVQLRSKKLTDGELYRLGIQMRGIADRYQKLYFVNDRLDIALATQADGIHLGQDDLPVFAAREICKKIGRSLWIGKSTHSIEQARQAILEKPDYIGVGPVFATPTKPGYRPAGIEYVRQAAEEFLIPFVAIGGIDSGNLKQVLEAGATRIAVVRAVFAAADAREATHQLKKEIENAIDGKNVSAH